MSGKSSNTGKFKAGLFSILYRGGGKAIGLTGSELHVLCAIASWNRGPVITVPHEYINERAGCGISTIKDAVALLIGKGVVLSSRVNKGNEYVPCRVVKTLDQAYLHVKRTGRASQYDLTPTIKMLLSLLDDSPETEIARSRLSDSSFSTLRDYIAKSRLSDMIAESQPSDSQVSEQIAESQPSDSQRSPSKSGSKYPPKGENKDMKNTSVCDSPVESEDDLTFDVESTGNGVDEGTGPQGGSVGATPPAPHSEDNAFGYNPNLGF